MTQTDFYIVVRSLKYLDSKSPIFLVKNDNEYCIFRPELPPLVLSSGLHQKPNKCHSK